MGPKVGGRIKHNQTEHLAGLCKEVGFSRIRAKLEDFLILNPQVEVLEVLNSS